MKKLLLLIMSLSLTAIACSSCDLFEPVESSPPITSSEKEEKTYTVTFMHDGAIVKTVEVKEGGSVSEKDIPAITPKTGYTIEWEDVELSGILADTVVKTVTKANTYTVTYDPGEGMGVPSDPQKVTYDSDVILPTPVREGFEFLGWDKGGIILKDTIKWTYAEDVTLIAQWGEKTVPTHTITFQKSDGFVLHTRKVEDGGSLTDIPAFPDDPGYTYSWSVTDFSNITENMTVTLNAVANKYTITFDPGEGALVDATKGTQEVTYNSAYTLNKPEVVYEGYKLTEWKGEASLPVNVWNLADNVTLTAVWQQIPPTMYTVTFLDQNGEVRKEVFVEEGGSVADTDIPAFPDDSGYTYSWDKAKADLSNITENITVTLNAVANKYTITYDLDGGSLKPDSADLSDTVTYKEEFTLNYPDPKKEGYKCVRWEIVGNDQLPAGNIWTLAKDVTLKAIWEKKATYTITFVQSGQELIKYENIEEGTDFTDNIPKCAEKPGYTVTWDSTKLESLKDVQGNVVVDAIEEPITYTITYSDSKGHFKGTIEILFNSEYDWTLDAEPITGYSFSKFTLQDGTEVAAKGKWDIAKDVTIVVEWKANTYTVVLDPKGGTCSQELDPKVYDQAYTLPEPTREGYTFQGWKWKVDGETISIPTSGTWTYAAAGTIELEASWKSDEWTNNY